MESAIQRVTHEELKETLKLQISNSMQPLKNRIKKFIANADKYLIEIEIAKKTPKGVDKLEALKDLLWTDFFQIQNEINSMKGQKIILSYVHIKPDGSREIRVSENDASHLKPVAWKGYEYQVNEHYKILKNSLPDEDQALLELTAQEVTNRWKTQKKNILWKLNGRTVGYSTSTLGPINEAYVNFYVHDIKLPNGTSEDEKNIDVFMLDSNYGAIKADNASGFMIGDVSRDGIQYAVKGRGGGPQSIKTVLLELKKLDAENFSDEAFNGLIETFTTKELEKNLAPLVRKIPDEVVSDMEKKYFKNLKNQKAIINF